MFEFLTQTFNASLIAVTQLFLSSVVTSNPWFEGLDLQYSGVKHEIVCSTKLADSFTETLDDVLLSGENITLHFRFELFAPGVAQPIQMKEVVNGFRYDEETESYYLIDSESGELERFFTIEAAKDTYISVSNLVIVNTENLSGEQDYFVQVTAFLDPIKLEDMSESVNLMLRWASVKPTIVSDKFRIQAKAT
ncbi:MAG: DUF4390 domain-containing protein [Candidatus Marinimicrobia bacterium]|jgi:hypothetical protein|nr:DUF4390 domain-containing protein [Candidatus Neomarinimicrobiota bacterium]MBT3576058.1 DUF4390 domain-containing protein [Candidatus Neomarinimicrobiota bacterium]MBT3679230.1 DUF4390 domain-containing protein [Candidatus Neomarinimicrobiota bacterium]MBT5236398.1 DUF4390 domain-containing protein [Candidatus Neomarinimicrobiota bacterium]MBT5785700.1 DUF4390 domain-containing protein [Candidatus Neomarinimicrobiota bacterium]